MRGGEGDGTYRLPKCRWRAFLRSPFTDGFTFTSALILFFLTLFAGGWPAIAAGAGLSLLLLSGLRLAVEADSAGIRVRNRFFHHRIRWDDVVYIIARERADLFTYIPTIDVVRGSAWLSTSLYAAVGLTRAQRREVALNLAQVAADAGYQIPVGTGTEPLNDAARNDGYQITG